MRSVIDPILSDSYMPNTRTSDGDIVILKLNESIPFNNFINPICLPRPEVNVFNLMGTVVGYGKSESLLNHEITPKYVEIVSVTQEVCWLSGEGMFGMSSNNTFCAAGRGKSPCKGKLDVLDF